MTDSATGAWHVDVVDGDHRYRFTNLVDHSAWQVEIRHQDGGDAIEIPGHISYGRKSFEVTLGPGHYKLTWQTTTSMLPARDGEPPVSPEEESAPFVLPLDGASSLEIAVEH